MVQGIQPLWVSPVLCLTGIISTMYEPWIGLMFWFPFKLSGQISITNVFRREIIIGFFSLININKPVFATLPAWRKDWEDSGGAFPQAGQGVWFCLPVAGICCGGESLCALPQVEQLLLRPACAGCFSGTPSKWMGSFSVLLTSPAWWVSSSALAGERCCVQADYLSELRRCSWEYLVDGRWFHSSEY